MSISSFIFKGILKMSYWFTLNILGMIVLFVVPNALSQLLVTYFLPVLRLEPFHRTL